MSTEIKVEHIARIEGHGDVYIRASKDQVEDVQMRVLEGARLFEAFLRGRKYSEAPGITMRICGICCTSHLMTSLTAVERALGIKESEQTRILRELMCMGEMIQSNSLHTYFLALPDFLGYPSALAMAGKYPKEVKRALAIKRVGNDINEVFGGRALHPVNCKIGGFYKLPTRTAIQHLLEKLKSMKNDAVKTVELFSSLDYGDFERKTQTLSLGDTGRYEFLRGKIISPDGFKIEQNQYIDYLKESVVDYSNTKLSSLNGSGFMVSALSRLNNNHHYLSDTAKEMLAQVDLTLPSYNPLHINVAQAFEILHCVENSIDLIENLDYRLDNTEYTLKAAEGIAYTEAPRGLLLHHYKFDEKGILTFANVITPTAAYLKNLEEDIRAYVPTVLDEPKEKIIFGVEKLIRAYDPCISCSCHSIKVNVDIVD